VLANNHVLDWAQDGLLETLAVLHGAGFRTAGAGRNVTEAASPAVLPRRDGGRILVFGFGATSSGIPRGWGASEDRPGIDLLEDLSPGTLRRIARRIGAVRQAGDVVVASIHWGGNWGYEVPRAQRRFARGLVDEAGVDVVHGHSSHHAKGIEVHRDRPILYGCGDFLNDYEGISGLEAFRGDLSLMYFPTIDAASHRLVGLEMVPLRIRNFRLNRATAQDSAWLHDVLVREGRDLGTRVRLGGDGSLALEWG
jgi:poly-gamma-glutamate synthesis protein (capsule biosynthesis protein)